MRKNIVKIAAIGVVSAAPGIAYSQDSMTGLSYGNGQWSGSGDGTLEFGAEGGRTLSDFSQRFAGGDFSDKLEEDIGGYGAISIGGLFGGGSPEAMGFDWRLVGSLTRHMENSEVDPDDPESFSARVDGGKFDFETIDIEIGKRFGADGVQGRVFAGLRGLHLKQGGEIFLLDYMGATDFGKLATNEFLGAGPRIGGEVRFGDRWGFVVGGSGSALFGRSDHVGEESFPGYTYAESESQWDWVTEATVQGALSFLSDKARVDVGYRAQNFWNVGGGLFGETGELNSDDVLVHGPYLSVTVKLD